jgi:serine/threonine protein kinase
MMPELAAIATARQRFIREARAAAAVSHEHVVTIHAVEEDHAPPFLVMQYVAGRSLQQRIDDTGALELKEILRIGMQAASGLAAAHAQGLVHRDIKPANILLENGVERVKITDFGLARVGDDSRVTQTGVVTGTPQYMAPEQARGEAVDQRADLFSLGGVLYAMCTGYAPFRASSSMAVLKKVCDESPRPISELNSEIPDWLVAIVNKLMAKDVKDRFQSASELSALLGQHLAHLQQPSQVAIPARVDPVRSPISPAETSRKSVALPIALMLLPLFVVPAIVLTSNFLDKGIVFGAQESVICLGVVGVPLFLVGLVLLISRLTTRPDDSANASSPAQARIAGETQAQQCMGGGCNNCRRFVRLLPGSCDRAIGHDSLVFGQLGRTRTRLSFVRRTSNILRQFAGAD